MNLKMLLKMKMNINLLKKEQENEYKWLFKKNFIYYNYNILILSLILNKAFFPKKSHISFKYLDFKRKAGNVLSALSSNKLQHITILRYLGLSADSMEYLDGFLHDEDTNFEGSYHVLAKNMENYVYSYFCEFCWDYLKSIVSLSSAYHNKQ